MADPRQIIEQNLQAPRRAQNESGSAEQHSLSEQIAAARYLGSVAASKRHPLSIIRRSPFSLPSGRELS